MLRFVGRFTVPAQRQGIVSVSRNDVNVGMEDLLPCCGAVRLDDVEAIELVDRFERPCNEIPYSTFVVYMDGYCVGRYNREGNSGRHGS